MPLHREGESKLLSAAEYKQLEKTDMGQELHLHNYAVNGEDNENGADGKTKEYQISRSGCVHLSHHRSKIHPAFRNEGRRETESWKEDEKASRTSVFSLMLIIYVVCAFYYYYLFIYYFLFSSLPIFQRHHGQGSCIKLLSLVSKGFLPVYLYISPSLHLSRCYLASQTHEALMRSKPDTYSSLLTPSKCK